jgi:hypothetical protein
MQSSSVLATGAIIPKDTLLKIEAKAATDFPDDYSKQENVIKAETKAYKEIENYKNKKVPKTTLENIKIKAAQDYPFDYGLQLSKIIRQSYSYIKLERLSGHSFAKAPAKLVDKLKEKVSREFPLDYTLQLSIILQQVNSELKLGQFSGHSYAPKIEKCKNLRWRVAGKGGREFYYWGTLAPGSADVIYLIVESNQGLIGQSFGFSNPDGTWEITIWGNYSMGTSRKEEFHCENY